MVAFLDRMNHSDMSFLRRLSAETCVCSFCISLNLLDEILLCSLLRHVPINYIINYAVFHSIKII